MRQNIVLVVLAGSFAASGFWPAPARAQSPGPVSAEAQDSDEITAVPNRPTLTTTAETTQKGVLEIEYGFEGARNHQNINGLVKFGLFPQFELRFLNNPFERDGGIASTGDSGAGFKLKLFPQKAWRPTFSVLYTAFLPTAGGGLGIGATGHQILLMASKDYGKQHFDVNFGPNWLGRAGATGYDRNDFMSLSWSTQLSRKWGVTAETAGFSRAGAGNPASMEILFAPTFSPRSWMVLDAGAYYGVYGNYPRWTIFAGVTYSIADLYKRRIAGRQHRRIP